MNKIKLGDILEIQPKSKVKAGEGITNGKYPFYTCSNELTKSVNNADYEGDALIMGTGGMASVHYEKGKFSTSTDCLVYKSHKNVNLSLINKYLRTNIYLLENGFKGAGLRHISRDYISNITIPLPERNLQDKIVKELDLIEKTIANHTDVLKKYDTLIKSRFIEMFGDISTGNYKFETRKLGSVSEVGSSHRVFTTEFVEQGVPFYRGTEIGMLANGQQPEEPFYISEEHYNRLTEHDSKPKIGDLLMPSICNKGQVWMVDTESPFYYKDGRVLSISPNQKIYNSKYLQYFMREKTIVEYPKLGSGSTFAEFKIFLLKDIDVLTPPISLQNDFATYVQQIDKSKFEIWRNLELCVIIIQKVFLL